MRLSWNEIRARAAKFSKEWEGEGYAIETMGNPAYSLELFQSVITVSLETMKTARSLRKLGIDR